MPLQTFAAAVGVSRCALLRPNPHKPASKLTWCLLFSPPAEPLWRQRCWGTDRPEVWGHFITSISHWGQRIYYNQLCAAWLHSFLKIKQERKKNTPLSSHLLIHLLPSPVFPLSVLLFPPGAQVVLPEVAPVCPSFIFPTPPFCHTLCMLTPRTNRTTSHQTSAAVVPNRPCTSDPSEVTVLTSVSQMGLYVTQQSHPAGCQACLSCRIYVPLRFCRPICSAVCGVRRQLRAPLLDKCLWNHALTPPGSLQEVASPTSRLVFIIKVCQDCVSPPLISRVGRMMAGGGGELCHPRGRTHAVLRHVAIQECLVLFIRVYVPPLIKSSSHTVVLINRHPSARCRGQPADLKTPWQPPLSSFFIN